MTSVVMAVCLAIGCQPGIMGAPADSHDSRIPAHASSQTGATAVRQAGPAESSIALEFDLPPELSARNADGTFVVRAMQVGLFLPGGELVRMLEIPRDEIRVTGQTAQVSVLAFPLPADANRVNARLRVLSSGPPGAWSEAVGPLTLPAIERPRRAPPAAAPRGVAALELGRRPALKEALTPLLGSDLSLEEALGSFSGVQDLATAIWTDPDAERVVLGVMPGSSSVAGHLIDRRLGKAEAFGGCGTSRAGRSDGGPAAAGTNARSELIADGPPSPHAAVAIRSFTSARSSLSYTRE